MVDSLGNNWFFLSVMWVLGTELVKVIRCAGKCLISRANLLTLSLLWSAFYFFNPCHSLELMSSSTFPHFVLLILSSRSKLLLPDHPAGSLSFSVVCSIPCAALSVFGVESVLCYFDFPHSLCSAEAVSSLPFSGSTYSLKSFSSDDTSHQLFILPRTSAVNTTQSSCYCHLIF